MKVSIKDSMKKYLAIMKNSMKNINKKIIIHHKIWNKNKIFKIIKIIKKKIIIVNKNIINKTKIQMIPFRMRMVKMMMEMILKLMIMYLIIYFKAKYAKKHQKHIKQILL